MVKCRLTAFELRLQKREEGLATLFRTELQTAAQKLTEDFGAMRNQMENFFNNFRCDGHHRPSVAAGEQVRRGFY
jgi:hypothetical protein